MFPRASINSQLLEKWKLIVGVHGHVSKRQLSIHELLYAYHALLCIYLNGMGAAEQTAKILISMSLAYKKV